MDQNKNFILIYAAWILNLVAFSGSMYFSNVMMLTPCVLCWYQRICIFPLSLLLAAGFLRKDPGVFWYATPLALIGWLISTYHNLLYYKVIPQAITACTGGVSCTEGQLEYLAFITIPLMAWTSLTLTLILLACFYQKMRRPLP